MSRRKRSKESRKAAVLPLLSPNAAGVDIGAREIFVAVPPDRDPEPVRSYATFTEDLHRLADWLQSCGIETVAMESTLNNVAKEFWPDIRRLLFRQK